MGKSSWSPIQLYFWLDIIRICFWPDCCHSCLPRLHSLHNIFRRRAKSKPGGCLLPVNKARQRGSCDITWQCWSANLTQNWEDHLRCILVKDKGWTSVDINRNSLMTSSRPTNAWNIILSYSFAVHTNIFRGCLSASYQHLGVLGKNSANGESLAARWTLHHWEHSSLLQNAPKKSLAVCTGCLETRCSLLESAHRSYVIMK